MVRETPVQFLIRAPLDSRGPPIFRANPREREWGRLWQQCRWSLATVRRVPFQGCHSEKVALSSSGHGPQQLPEFSERRSFRSGGIRRKSTLLAEADKVAELSESGGSASARRGTHSHRNRVSQSLSFPNAHAAGASPTPDSENPATLSHLTSKTLSASARSVLNSLSISVALAIVVPDIGKLLWTNF